MTNPNSQTGTEWLTADPNVLREPDSLTLTDPQGAETTTTPAELRRWVVDSRPSSQAIERARANRDALRPPDSVTTVDLWGHAIEMSPATLAASRRTPEEGDPTTARNTLRAPDTLALTHRGRTVEVSPAQLTEQVATHGGTLTSEQLRQLLAVRRATRPAEPVE